ncbi:PorT family protein [Adhaeribacter sp. BT258]|uniref:PorT family protein n=1 Tax=Adhaeribacter terrigena TaxID=2793070 RepID=A0ABS1C259_9BACT|nr:porin family protein [Adhaeribacter terrigena]MBK0403410.1 PorT family protein [Adhaeribacter terrigena]
MKKLLLGAFLVLSGMAVQAQEIIRPLSAGLKAGANMANILQDGSSNKSIYGIQAGLVADYLLTKKHAVRAELLYSGKGFVQTEMQVKNSLTYLELPLLYKRSFFCHKKGGNVLERSRKGNFFALAGPQLSVLLSSTAKIQNSALVAEGSATTTGLYAYTRPFDISAVAGVGYCLKNGFSIDARYALGLRHLHGSPHLLIPQNAQNSTLQMGISYLMPVNF